MEEIMDRLACVLPLWTTPKKEEPGARRRASAGCRADCNNLMILAIAGRSFSMGAGLQWWYVHIKIKTLCTTFFGHALAKC